MLTVVKKWKVTIGFKDESPIALFIHDDHMSNVFRQLSMMTFEYPITSIVVGEAPAQSNQMGTLTQSVGINCVPREFR